MAMASMAPAPILSVRGTWNALRVPKPHDYVFSAKAALAVAIALGIGFSQDLENPYWSALTVYVLVGQPEAGAIRSKAIFRFAGTLLGGAVSILVAIKFASHVGALLIASIIAILVTYYPKTLDRTPTSYTWFVAPLTIAVVNVSQAAVPATIFMTAMNRMLEICLAILLVGLIDSVILPRAATPGFTRLVTDWRNRASTWAAAALAPDALQTIDARRDRRLGLHKLAGLLAPLGAAGIQLPYDIVAAPPRRRDMRLVRLLVAHIIVHLASSNIWIEAARRADPNSDDFEAHPAAVRAWIEETPAFESEAILAHAKRGSELRDSLLAFSSDDAGPGDYNRLLQASALLRLSELVINWSRLERIVHAVVTGTRPCAALRTAARLASPVHSTDYVLGLLDTLPLAIALSFCAAIWYLTTWSAGLYAMVFVYIAMGFILGTPGVLRSSRGIGLWITIASVITLFYQFAVLPRVTAFPVLLAVLLAGIIPLGLLVAMSPAGVLILANGFAFLGLQSAYAADFRTTLEVLLGSLAGCLIAYGALHICQFDRARFEARRLARALRRDLVDIANSGRLPNHDRLLSLSVDRMSLYFGVVDSMPPDDPLHREDLVDTFRMASNLLRLREQESRLPSLHPSITTLRDLFVKQYADGHSPDRAALLSHVDTTYAGAIELPGSEERSEALAALIGLRLSLAAPSPFAVPAQGAAA